jgi:hypothetical protein
VRNQLGQQLKPLRIQLSGKDADARATDSASGEHRLALLGPRPDTLGVVF